MCLSRTLKSFPKDCQQTCSVCGLLTFMHVKRWHCVIRSVPFCLFKPVECHLRTKSRHRTTKLVFNADLNQDFTSWDLQLTQMEFKVRHCIILHSSHMFWFVHGYTLSSTSYKVSLLPQRGAKPCSVFLKHFFLWKASICLTFTCISLFSPQLLVLCAGEWETAPVSAAHTGFRTTVSVLYFIHYTLNICKYICVCMISIIGL